MLAKRNRLFAWQWGNSLLVVCLGLGIILVLSGLLWFQRISSPNQSAEKLPVPKSAPTPATEPLVNPTWTLTPNEIKATYTFYVDAFSSTISPTTGGLRPTGTRDDVYDTEGNNIIKPKQKGESIRLDGSLNGRTARLPVGTAIFLYFPTGKQSVSVVPEQGIIEVPKGRYFLPKGDIALLVVVGKGRAVITVTTAK